MPELSAGDRVEVYNLVARPDLNGKLGSLVRFDSDVERWQVKLDGHSSAIRARAANLRRDRIEIAPDDSAPLCVMRPEWSDPRDVKVSAHAALVKYMTGKCQYGFTGKVYVHLRGEPAAEFKLSPITLIPASKLLWNSDQLIGGIKRAISPDVPVKEAPVSWDNPSDNVFNKSMSDTIIQAHGSSTVYVAIRTESNTQRFGLLHVLSGASPDVPMALLGHGTIVCSPTEAIVFHRDNMVKLPRTLSLEQAVRKVADVVENGIETPCPICLEFPTDADPTVFMPCVCKASIHLSCFQKLQDAKTSTCPVCRSPLGTLEAR